MGAGHILSIRALSIFLTLLISVCIARRSVLNPSPLRLKLRGAMPMVWLMFSDSGLICVREDHTGEGEAVNTIVSLSLDGSTDQQILVSGSDFYSSPRLSPDGTQLAWINWNHPNMPWDSTELWVAAISADRTLEEPQKIAGGRDESGSGTKVVARWSAVLYQRSLWLVESVPLGCAGRNRGALPDGS
jgi:hypothetical protein